MLSSPYYAENYAGIIDTGLPLISHKCVIDYEFIIIMLLNIEKPAELSHLAYSILLAQLIATLIQEGSDTSNNRVATRFGNSQNQEYRSRSRSFSLKPGV